MATAYMLVERRLQELEFQIHHPSTEEPPTNVEDDTDTNTDMQRKFTFLRTFLAAEIESYNGDKPDHLRELSDRLDMLEEAYSKGRVAPGSDVVYEISSCSCTETCVEGEKEEEVEEKVVVKKRWKWWWWLIGVAVAVGAVAVAVVVANVEDKLPYLVPT